MKLLQTINDNVFVFPIFFEIRFPMLQKKAARRRKINPSKVTKPLTWFATIARPENEVINPIIWAL